MLLYFISALEVRRSEASVGDKKRLSDKVCKVMCVYGNKGHEAHREYKKTRNSRILVVTDDAHVPTTTLLSCFLYFFTYIHAQCT